MTKKEKEIKELAQQDWNEQCKNFMMYRIPFREKTFTMTAREFLNWAGYDVNEVSLYVLTRYIGGDVDYSQFPDAAVVTQDGIAIADCDEEPARFQDWVQYYYQI